ncbi:MAG TPA: BlaI/MecI/CopY family transcriptional regulator [Ruania sp.]|nr:BlaI/MecI/CopY family transcriptional regulator [Ruania sp.]
MGRRARGELEAQVLRVLWEQSEPVSAGLIQEQLPGPSPAYTTVLTVLDRLQKKGQVVRSGESPRKVRFRAARSGDEHTSSTMIGALDEARDRQAALLQFAGNLSADDVEVLQRALTGRKR